jgi:hypothetical protein
MFLALFVKWVLQTNKKIVFEEPAVSALISVVIPTPNCIIYTRR